MRTQTHVALFGDAPRLADRLSAALAERGFAWRSFDLTTMPASTPADIDLAMLVLDQHHVLEHPEAVVSQLEHLSQSRTPTLVWGMPENAGAPTGALLDCVPADANLEEVLGRLTTLAHYAPMIRQMQAELTQLQRLGEHLHRYFGEIDQELRLAGRLQRDFLPTKLPQVPPLSFAALYRPATWVSGDTYDVFRIDEHHVGVFLADAMGHGVAAGLLTMFLRQALVTKRIQGKNYQIVGPAEALNDLHQCLLKQGLPNCQFVTAAYAIINCETLMLRLARAGHPGPLLLGKNGHKQQIGVPSGLLGIPEIDPEVSEARVKLTAGDRLLLFTDGIEDVFFQAAPDPQIPPPFDPVLDELAAYDVRTMVQRLGDHLDRLEGSLHPSDDMTVLAMEVAE